MTFSQLPVSVIICVKNAEDQLKSCLTSVFSNNPKEVIVVDGNSTDATLQIVSNYQDILLLSDGGLGLSHARRLGVLSASSPYILFVGPDNILPHDFISTLLCLFKSSPFDAATVQTRIKSPITFWDYGADFKLRLLMEKPGPKSVVGTPTIYSKQFLSKVNYLSSDLGPCDDTDIGYRASELGLRLGLLPLCVFENNGHNFFSTWSRYVWYGKGDFKFFNKYSKSWPLSRRLLSISHPIRQCFSFSAKSIYLCQPKYIPWFILSTFARYYGWIFCVIRSLVSFLR